MTLITAAPLDHARLVTALDPSGIGAIATFVGLVRDHNKGRKVLHLNRATNRSRWARSIVAESRKNGGGRLAIHHRIGRMEIGEASVAIAAASPHRADAFAASRYAIERIKQIVPIWKHEYFDGGDVWIEGATADPDNAAAREEALRIACA